MTLRIDDHFSMAEWSQMDEFLARTHGARHVMRDRELFEWFYCRDESQPDRANLVVAHDDSDLVAILGYVPSTFLLGGQKVPGTWTALWYSLPEYRHGVGALLLRRLTEIFDIVAGQGATEMNRAIVKAMGHSFVEVIPKVVRVLDAAAVSRWLPGYHMPPFHSTGGEASAEVARPLSNSSYTPDWNQYPDLAFSTLRDFEYLHRRYVQFPFLDYQVMVLGRARTCSVAVVRVVEVEAGLKVARMVEFFGPDLESFRKQSRSLLEQVIQFCSARGCAYLDFFCTSTDSIAFFEECGFSRDDIGELPGLLDPVDFSRSRSQNLEYFVSPGFRSKVQEENNWMYASRGDGDGDRPNATHASMKRIGL